MPENTSTQDIATTGKIAVGPFFVHKLTLKEYALVFAKLKRIPQLLGELETLDQNELAKTFPAMFTQVFDELSDVFAVACGVSKDEIMEKTDIDLAGDLIEAFFKLNNFLALGKRLNGAVAPRAAQAPAA